MRTYKFRLYPNKEQQSKLWKHANIMNKLYNYFLDQRIQAYENKSAPIRRKDQQAELVQLKKANPELKQIYSQVLQQVPLRLDRAYKVFFRRMKLGQGKPHFRSCKKFFGILYPQSGYKITNNNIYTSAYGNIKFIKHRELKGNIKQITITTQDNKWYLCVVTDYETDKEAGTKTIGIDIGITNLVATSEGKIIKNKTHAKYFDREINKLKSRRDTKCKKNSRRYKFLTKVIMRLYGVKNRKINDFLHKVSKNLTQYDTIIIEDLSVKKMSEGNIKGLNREIRNSCLSRFIQMLEYKANKLIKVNPANTSKMCNSCGKLHKMPLSKRTLVCECGNQEDRDVNAAKNIFCLGQAYLLQGSTAVLTQEALGFSQG